MKHWIAPNANKKHHQRRIHTYVWLLFCTVEMCSIMPLFVFLFFCSPFVTFYIFRLCRLCGIATVLLPARLQFYVFGPKMWPFQSSFVQCYAFFASFVQSVNEKMWTKESEWMAFFGLEFCPPSRQSRFWIFIKVFSIVCVRFFVSRSFGIRRGWGKGV